MLARAVLSKQLPSTHCAFCQGLSPGGHGDKGATADANLLAANSFPVIRGRDNRLIFPKASRD